MPSTTYLEITVALFLTNEALLLYLRISLLPSCNKASPTGKRKKGLQISFKVRFDHDLIFGQKYNRKNIRPWGYFIKSLIVTLYKTKD